MTLSELRDQVDVAIICVNVAESSAVLRHFPTVKTLQGERTYRIAVVEREDGQEMTVAVVVSSEGPIESAKTMEHIASQLDPTLVLMVGIAGGIPQRKGSLVFGDVALSLAGLDVTRAELNPGRSYRAKDEKPFDLQMWALDLVKNTHVNDCWASPEMVKVERPPDEELIKYPECNEAWFSEVKRNFAERDHSRPVLLRGTFSSGYGFLRDDTLAKKWRKILESANYPPLVANEMELIGVHTASSGQKRNHQYLVIKGVSDIIGLQRTGPWTPYAAATAASFAFGFVRALTFDPKIRNGARDASPRPPRGRDTLPWLRFWCPTSKTCQLDKEGFLVDPRGPFARAINPHVVTLDSLDEMGCLVLLGEPGMGKSVALSGEFWRVFPEAPALWWSMEGYSDEARLVQELFSSEHWCRWLDSDYTLWLFIDAFDEGLLEVRKLAQILASQLEEAPLSRLYLRVTCRAADWPAFLSERLSAIWNDNYLELNLAPLTAGDVDLATKASGVDTAMFLASVRANRVVPFVTRPVTLRLLLGLYQQGGKLPSEQEALFARGCRLLCSEINLSRLASRQQGNLDPGTRLTISEEIAALSELCGRPIIYTGPDTGDASPMDLTLDELSSVTSRSASDLKEALSTALFSSRGSQRLGWSHQTYSEFLAAKFLATTTSFDQQLELLTDKDTGKLIPQLQETGSWLASMSQPLRNYLIEKQPEKLLASMAVVLDPVSRKRLVERILGLYQNKELPDSLLRDHYDKVCHPGLANQIKPFIVDGKGSYLVRRGAIEMAKACGLEVLGETLLTVALDPKEPEYTRICAADALLEVGKEEVRFQLLPLLYDSEEDPDDELRGYALAATWPGRLATNEMFDALNPPKNRNLWGSYRGFLVRELPARLKDEDLPLALDWLTTAKGWESFHEEETLTLAIVSRALESGEALTQDALAKLLVERVRSRGTGLTREVRELLKHRLQESGSLRRGLLTRIVPLLNGVDETIRFSWSGLHLANADDTEWMLEQLSQAPADKIPIWSRLIGRRFDPTDDLQRQLVQTAARAHSALWDEVKELLSPPPPDTEDDSGTRPAWPEWRSAATTPTPIMELAVKVVPAEPLNWIPVALALHDANCTTTRGALTASNIWASLTSETQARIVEAAEVFVRNADPDTESWWGSNRYNSLVIEGVRALQLLLDQKPQIVSQLSAEIWDRWIPCLLTWGGDTVSNLLVLAYQYAPETTRNRVSEKVQFDAAHLGDVRITEYFNLLGDDELADLLLHWLECTQVPDRAHVTVLSWLLTQGHNGSRARVTEALQATGADERGRILSGLALARTAQPQDWALIWDHVISVAALGHTFVERLIEGWHICAAQLVSRLEESQLGSLLEWMFQEFPPEQDAVPQGAHVVSTRQRIGRWRDQILENLQSRGTPEAAKALGKVAERFPERAWLGWKRDDAWENARSLMWRPLTPSEVMAVIRGAPRADGGGPIPRSS